MTEKEIKVSVIVPVYNVKKYLSKCLDSIIAQTLKEIEIICVNDGSTDGSDKVLEEYAKKDDRIKIVNRKNGGLSAARNTGMPYAKGKYIGFIDSDDYVEPTMYELMYYNAEHFQSQMVICAVHKIDDTTGIVFDDDPYYTLGYFPKELDNRSFTHYDTKDFFQDFCVMAWNKLYLRSYLEEKQARFPDGYIFEDGPFFTDIYFDMKRVTIVRDFLYYYRVNRANSIVAKGDKNFTDIFFVVNKMLNNLRKTSYFDEVKAYFLRKKFKDMRYRYQVIQNKYKKYYYDKWREFWLNIDEKTLEDEKFKERYPYTYRNIRLVRENDYFQYQKEFFIEKCKHKIMEILHLNPKVYTFKIKKFHICIKKRPKLFDWWYDNNRMFIAIYWLKIKFDFPFMYTELEDWEDSVK